MAKYEGKFILTTDNHAARVISRLIKHAGFQKLSLIRLVPHSSHVAKSLDLYIFGLLEMFYFKERKPKA
jgi:hypothetical protein